MRLMSEPDETHQHAEWIYGARLDGHRAPQDTMEAGLTSKSSHVAIRVEVRFLPGYVDGKESGSRGVSQGHDR